MTLIGNIASINDAVLMGNIAGIKGDTGVGIASITENDDYTITITFTDGSAFTTDPIAGFADVAFDENYDLVVTKTDGTTIKLETDLGSAVSDWLSEHPEATTVQDGSLTEAKFSSALKLKTLKDYVTPEMFGAVGDGTTDDTTAVRNALTYSIDNGIKLLLPNIYYITSSLLTVSDYSGTVVVNIEGTRPLKNYEYTIDRYGGIKFQNGINVFDGVTIRGSIYRVSFAPVSRTQTGSIFYNCKLSAFSFEHCSVSNILAFCHNTSLSSVSQILFSRFLTVYYFAKCDSDSDTYKCTDSTIAYNYINGGGELNNNHCFEWIYFNGSTITKNFIDYYQIIYYPVKLMSGGFVFHGGISEGNQYQVFRHLYAIPDNVSSFYFSSNNDCFNWTDVSKLEKLSNFEKLTYTGHDGNTHECPPSILWVQNDANVIIKNAIIQDNCKNIVFIRSGISNYNFARAEFDGIYSVITFDDAVVLADSIYNNGNYKLNQIKIPFIKEVESLPDVNGNWLEYYIGQLVKYNNNIYKLLFLYENSAWSRQWINVTSYM